MSDTVSHNWRLILESLKRSKPMLNFLLIREPLEKAYDSENLLSFDHDTWFGATKCIDVQSKLIS